MTIRMVEEGPLGMKVSERYLASRCRRYGGVAFIFVVLFVWCEILSAPLDSFDIAPARSNSRPGDSTRSHASGRQDGVRAPCGGEEPRARRSW